MSLAAFTSPSIDYHAFAPEIILVGVLLLVLVVDLVFEQRARAATSTLAAWGLLASMVPIVTLAVDGGDRSMFGGAYVVDDFALVMKALFLGAGFLVVLLSSDYIAEGDFYEGEYYFMLLASLAGMTMMASSRDLISIFIALELLSIPAYLLAGWRKRDLRGNEASLKYYLLGVFASAVMLYGMSLLFGVAGSTLLTTIGERVSTGGASIPMVTVAIVFVVAGFAFKVSAVPFHTWAPDTYEGAPTPITAFLSVASKAAGFVALLSLVYLGFYDRADVWAPLFWTLAALTMTVGNLIALRQTNVIRLLAYSSVAQAGFMLVPLAVAGEAPESSLSAIVTYMLIYTVMNLGAFGVVMAVARKTRSSAELTSFGGLFEYVPGLTVLLTIFFFALAGIPPLGGWYAKFAMFRAVFDSGTPAAVVLGVVAAVNSVIALFYYANVAKEAWMAPVPDDDRTPVRIPPALGAAVGAHRHRHARRRGAPAGRRPLRRPRHVRPGELTALAAIAARIEREGPIRFDVFVELALYGDGGFFATGGGAGRRADFLTSPEVGPLYGAVLARAVDAEWTRLGRPDPFVVIEGGAGRGALAKAILDAEPACLPALRYVCVERSAALRAEADSLLPTEPAENIFGAVVGGDLDEERVVPGTGPVVAVLDDLPRVPVVGMIIGNELLDNLPFRLFERAGGGWHEVLVATDGQRLHELLVEADEDTTAECHRVAPDAAPGGRIPLQHEASAWIVRAQESVRRGRIVLVDYAADTPSMAARPWTEWLRTYRGHARGGAPLDGPGEQDVTCEVAVDQLRPPSANRSQAEWLAANGIDELADAARAEWQARAHIGDLRALKARSRAGEADAITDPTGLGAFRVLEWQVD